MPSAVTRTASVNSSRDCVRHARQQPRNRPAADDDGEDRERRDFCEREHDGRQARCATAGKRRHQHEDEHREQVLDHQPSDGNVT
jgi:hypothetical protein